MKKFSYLLAISLIAGSILTGCGGNGSSNDDTKPSATASTPASTPASSTASTPASSTASTPASSTASTPASSTASHPPVADGECEGYLPC